MIDSENQHMIFPGKLKESSSEQWTDCEVDFFRDEFPGCASDKIFAAVQGCI